MKYIVGYAPVMSYPYCWQPQEPSLFRVYFKSNHITSQYSNLQPGKFMPTSLLSAMPPLITQNFQHHKKQQQRTTLK
jgi:hypothetical protein